MHKIAGIPTGKTIGFRNNLLSIVYANDALIFASYFGYYEAIKIFLAVQEININTKAVNFYKITSLIWASKNG